MARNRIIETRECRTSSSFLHHELIPNTICRSRYPEWDTAFRVNNLGFRGEDMAFVKPKDTYRILFLGDSFIEGEGAENRETAVWVAGQELTAKTGKKIETVNLGVMSYSPIIYERVIKRWTDELKPDLVIINIDMSDFQNDYSYNKDLDKDGNFRNILFQQKMGEPHIVLPLLGKGIKHWLRTHFLVYSEIADRIKQLVRKIEHLPEPTVFQVNDPLSDPHFVTRSPENAKNPLMWGQFGKSMININNYLEQQKISWLATIYPYGHQAAGDEWARGRLQNGFESGKVYETISADLLVEFGNKNGFKVFNLVPAFQKAAAENTNFLYYPYDGHFTPLGHRIMADQLKEIIYGYIAHHR